MKWTPVDFCKDTIHYAYEHDGVLEDLAIHVETTDNEYFFHLPENHDELGISLDVISDGIAFLENIRDKD
ncbi:MAG: hypothetical protein JW384_01413 [Nitrosomonadaceae bacterium]|nr:hypothetical protein [Nitrosomonadaceae bacterium]